MHEELIRSRRSREMVYGGPLGPHIDGFLTAVSTIGYTSSSLRDLANGAVQFSRYLTSTGVVDASTLCDQVVEGFVATQPARRCHDHYRMRCGRGIRAAHHLLRYLRSIGVTPPEAVPEYAYSWILMEWLAFLRNHRGLKPNSLDVYRRLVEPFLQDLDGDAAPDDFAALTPDCVRKHVQRRARTLARSTRKTSSLLCAVFWALLLAEAIWRVI